MAISILAGCDAERRGESVREVVVDTLPGGWIHVRNPSSGAWELQPDARWRVLEHVRIGRIEGEGPDLWGTVGSMAEDVLGRVWIADGQGGELRIFDSDGAFVRSVGGIGEGPGEFQRLGAVLNAPDGTMWTHDTLLRRWEVFDTSAVRVAGHPANSNDRLHAWTPDGRLLQASLHFQPGGETLHSERLYTVRRIGPSGALIDESILPPPPVAESEKVHFVTEDGSYTIVGEVPMVHRAMLVLGPDGDFWVTDGGGPYRIRRQRLEGDTVLILERSYPPVELSEEELQQAREALRPPEGMNSDDNDPGRIPTVHPPFDNLYPATDGTLWLRRDLGGGAKGLDVFAPDGRYLGEVESSVDLAALSVRLITKDRIYAVDTDDLGVQYVVLLRIERPGTAPSM